MSVTKICLWTHLLCCTLGMLGTAQLAWAQTALGASHKATSLEVSEGPKGTMIRIRGAGVPTFSVFKLAAPARLFVDISNSAPGQDAPGGPTLVNNGVVSQVAMLAVRDAGQPVTRIIIGFEHAAHYDVRAEGGDVVVFIDGSKRHSTSPAPQPQDDLVLERAKVEAARQELERTRATLEDSQQERQALADRLNQAQGSNRQVLQSELEAKDRLIASLKKKEGETDTLRAERQDALGRAERAEAKAKTLEQQVARSTAEAARTGSLAAKLTKESEQRSQELEALNSRLIAAQKERERMAKQLGDTQSQALSAQQRLELKNTELSQVAAQVQALEQKLGATKELAIQGDSRAQAALKSIEAEKLERTKSLARAKQELELATTAANGLESKLATMQAKEEARVQEFAKLQQKLALTQTTQDEAVATAERENQRLRAELERVKRDGAARGQALLEAQGAQQKREQELAALKERQAQAQALLAKAEQEAKDAKAQNAALAARTDVLAKQSEALAAQSAKVARKTGPVAKAVALDVTSPNMVRDIRLETHQGRSRIVVELDRPGQFETMPAGTSGRAVMILNQTSLPKEFGRTLSGETQSGAVRFVSSFAQDGQVHLEAELQEHAAETIRHEGNTLIWEFAPSLAQVPDQGPVVADAAPKRAEAGLGLTSAAPLIVVDPTKQTRVPGMRRKRLTLDLRDADIQNVLRFLSREGGVNIIASEGVSGSVTLSLRGVSLDQAFLMILQDLRLGFEKRGNIIRVAPQATLLEEEERRAKARAALEQNKPLQVFLLPVNYARAGEMTTQVETLLSGRGSVSIDERTNTLIIREIDDNIERIRELVERLDTQVPQVLIEARIVETNDVFNQEFGIQWGGGFSFSQANGNPTGLMFPSTLGVAGAATDQQTPVAGTSPTPNFAVNLPAAIGTGSGGGIGLTMGSAGGAVNLNLRLSALEELGHARIISAPKVMTLDNRRATISQGTSIPISVVGVAGVQTQFVQADLELEVQPHVTPDGNVQMRIRATKNEPDFQNTGARGDPTILRREAETELLIKDGDTTVIGGIYTRNTGRSLSAVPFFYKIPILGALFRSTSESERRNELLIFITPKIVNRAESFNAVSIGTVKQVSSPTPAGPAQPAAPARQTPPQIDTNLFP